MRKANLYAMDRDESIALLAAAPFVHLASTTADGAPVLRALHGAVLDGALTFHGAPVGEKTEAIGRPAVVCADEIVAEIPSYWIHPERACPATTYYRSVQVHGTIERVDDPAFKARAMAALMDRYQPQGGFVPIEPDHALYRKELNGVMVLRVALEQLDGKAKLGQNRTPAELCNVVARLWERGAPGDAAAIERVLRANPAVPTPAFLACPDGAALCIAPPDSHAETAARLLDGAYWNAGIDAARMARAHLGSTAWVTAIDRASGDLVASARAVSDGAKHAWVYDVVVAPAWRARGLAKAVVRTLLDHPRVRDARRVWLGTRDAQGLYAKLGFVEKSELPPKGYDSTDMVLVR